MYNSLVLSVNFWALGLLILYANSVTVGGRQSVNDQSVGKHVTEVLNTLINDKNYDKRVRPSYGGPAVEVNITMFIISWTLSDKTSDMTIDFYFRQSWNDPRLAFNENKGVKKILAADLLDKIWTPDTFFTNEKSGFHHQVPAPNVFIRLDTNGDVFMSHRLTMTLDCPMNLQYFPMDRQMCSIDIESYGFSTKDITYHWGKDKASVEMSDSNSMAPFKVLGFDTKTSLIKLKSGEYMRLQTDIRFERSTGRYKMALFYPTDIVVALSWIAFWLNPKHSVSRLSLAAASVLGVSALMAYTNSYLPDASYSLPTDVFLMMSFFLTFGALLESTLVAYLMSKKESETESEDTECGGKLIGEKTSGKRVAEMVNNPSLPGHVDLFSRIAFPVVFVLFQIIFFNKYADTSDIK